MESNGNSLKMKSGSEILPHDNATSSLSALYNGILDQT